MTWIDFALRILSAGFLGGIIGAERQWRQRRAGLRTNALVATGAAAFVTLPTLLPPHADSSPTRIAAQVVSGIGFLGAGVILREGLNIRGLNTAATLWCSAAVGVLAGSNILPAAFITALTVVGANLLLQPLARLIDRQPMTETTEVEVFYCLRAICPESEEPHIRALLLQEIQRGGFLLKSLRSENVAGSDRVEVEADVVSQGGNDRTVEQIASRLSMEPSISAISWEIAESSHWLSGPSMASKDGED